MARLILILITALILAACGAQPDRCTTDPSLPDCRAGNAIADATIAAANANSAAIVRQSYMRATQDAVALHAQATQGAINTQATAAVVSADATRSAMQIDAMRQSLAYTATLQAAQFTVVTTKAALEGDAKISAAQVQASTAQAGQWVTFGVPTVLLVSIALYIVVYTRRIGAAVAAGVETRTSLIRYGYRNERVAYRVQHKDGSLEFIPLDQILGHSSRYLDALTVPDLAKLAATVEADKRLKFTQLAHGETHQALPGSIADQALPASLPLPLGEGRGEGVSAIPTFAEYLKFNRPTPERMLFAYGETGPIHGRLDQLLSVEIVGRQGQGKTTLLRLIYAQCLIVGVQIVVWDLHEDIVDDLPGAQTYTSATAIEQSAAALEQELDRRIGEHDKTATPVMALVDEINQLVNVVPIVAHVIGRLVNEGRKYKMFCIISAKGLPATLFGGSTVRDAFSSRFAFQTTTRQAAMIGFDREVVPAVRDLVPGRALFEGPIPAQVVSVPYTTADDVKAILATSSPIEAAFFSTSTTSPEVDRHFQPAQAEVTPEVGVEVTPEVTERHRQVRDLLRARTPISQIVRQVWNVGPGGRAYTQATAELTQIMSELI